MKKLLLFIVALSFSLQAQDLLFLNSNQSLINLNPSFAGSNGFIRNQSSLRMPFEQNSYRQGTLGNSFDIFLRPIKGGLAFSASDEVWYGNLKRRYVISISYAQYLSFYKGNLKVIPSVQANHDTRHINSDWIIGTNTTTIDRQFLFGGGLLVNYKNKFFIGTYIREQWQTYGPSIGVSTLVHASYNTSLNESVLLQLSGRYFSQQAFNYVQIGVNSVLQKHIIAGLQYISFIERPVFNLGYRGDLFSVVAGYDFTVSKLARNEDGYAELHLSFNLRNKENRHPSSLLSFETW